MKRSELFKQARDLLATPGVWVNSPPQRPSEHHCMITAVAHVVWQQGFYGTDVWVPMTDCLAREVDMTDRLAREVEATNLNLGEWNDRPGRTLDEVLAVFDRVIAKELAREAHDAGEVG